jgi:hypothetical protein
MYGVLDHGESFGGTVDRNSTSLEEVKLEVLSRIPFKIIHPEVEFASVSDSFSRALKSFDRFDIASRRARNLCILFLPKLIISENFCGCRMIGGPLVRLDGGACFERRRTSNRAWLVVTVSSNSRSL